MSTNSTFYRVGHLCPYWSCFYFLLIKSSKYSLFSCWCRLRLWLYCFYFFLFWFRKCDAAFSICNFIFNFESYSYYWYIRTDSNFDFNLVQTFCHLLSTKILTSESLRRINNVVTLSPLKRYFPFIILPQSNTPFKCGVHLLWML